MSETRPCFLSLHTFRIFVEYVQNIFSYHNRITKPVYESNDKYIYVSNLDTDIKDKCMLVLRHTTLHCWNKKASFWNVIIEPTKIQATKLKGHK